MTSSFPQKLFMFAMLDNTSYNLQPLVSYLYIQKFETQGK